VIGFGPDWASDTGCCGKPVGCTNLTEACLMRRHWWKRRHAGETIDEAPAVAEEDADGELQG
jgi:hypothetical protein